MEIREYIYQSMLRYPSIFPTKWHVLDHMLLTVGNGLEWQNGELVDINQSNADILNEETAIQHAIDFNIEMGNRNNFHKDLWERHMKNAIQREIEIIINVKNVVDETEPSQDMIIDGDDKTLNPSKERQLTKEGRYFQLYPFSYYAEINNIPEDIKPDWKAEIINFYQKVMKPLIESGNYSLNGIELPNWITK